MTRALAGALVAAALACAQPQAPPGGQVDRTAPRVIGVTPAMYDTISNLSAPVVIRFDERLSERLHGVPSVEAAVLVSPVTGEVDVERGRSEVRIRVAGGWRPGLVYHVVVLPAFADRFQNRRTEAVELVFSTGAPIPETAVAGFVQDRLTGRAVQAARVEATRRIDSLTYVAVSDSSGFFALRHIPAGAYDLRAWVDANRNRTPEFGEPQHHDGFAVGFQDTVVVELPLLPRDTTAARLTRAEPVDSTKVRLTFDDHFEPGPVDGAAAVYLLADTSLVAEGRLVHGSRLDSIIAAERAAADTLAAAADAAAADTLPAPEDTAAALPRTDPRVMAERTEARRPPASARPPGPPLPTRELILLLPEPLPPGQRFLVVAEGVTNIHGIAGGGGSATFATPRREPAGDAPPGDPPPAAAPDPPPAEPPPGP